MRRGVKRQGKQQRKDGPKLVGIDFHGLNTFTGSISDFDQTLFQLLPLAIWLLHTDTVKIRSIIYRGDVHISSYPGCE